MMKDWSSKTWWVFLVSLRNYPNSLKTKGSAGRKSGEFQATFTSRMISWIRFFSFFHRKEPDVRLPLHSIIPRLACWVRSKLVWSPGEKGMIMNHKRQTHRRMMVWAFSSLNWCCWRLKIYLIYQAMWSLAFQYETSHLTTIYSVLHVSF